MESNGKPSPRQGISPRVFSFLAVLLGGLSGVGAAAFRALVAGFHNLLLLGKLSFLYDANVHTPENPWGLLVILIPVAGALGVSLLVSRFAPEAKGRGVPEVMDAVYYAKGVIRPVVAPIKTLASALSIGSGGSVGREGPIIQIGAAFGSTVSRWIPMAVWQRITLVASGAAGGIAATFNTPVGGILFAAELLMPEISVRTLVPVAIATATATYVGRMFFGARPSFVIPAFEQPYFPPTQPAVLFAYVGLGLLMGLAAALYIKSLGGFEDFFEQRIRLPYPVRHMLGMLPVGILLYVLWSAFERFYIEGGGYATIQDVLSGALGGWAFLLLLFSLKLLSTSLSLGSGASGGVFSPSLFMGATLGAAYGSVLQSFFPGLPVTPPAFAVAGMAGMVGGVTGAALTTIVMLFEMTLDYSVVVPMIITVALSNGLRWFLSPHSIYTTKLARRGHFIPSVLQKNVPYLRRAKEIMETRLSIVPASCTVGSLPQISLEHRTVPFYLIEESHRLLGIATGEAALEALGEKGPQAVMEEIADRKYCLVAEDSSLCEVLARMRAKKTPFALVSRRTGEIAPGDVSGVITDNQIWKAVEAAIELFAD